MMNKRLLHLVKGELIRLNKYNVTSVSFFVAVIWGVILFFIDNAFLSTLLPFVLIMDATMMSVMYVGSVMFFEKNESTISTLLVTPVKNSELVLSKVLANTIHNMFSSILIIIVFVIFKDVQLNYLLIVIGILLATAFHTIAGVILAYFQKDFTGMLLNIMILSFILFIPSALFTFGIITGKIWEYLLLLNPVQAATEIINGGFQAYTITWKYYFSLCYLITIGLISYYYYALPKFQDYAIKQSGV